MSDIWDSVAEVWEENADFLDHQLEAATRVLLDAASVSQGDDLLDLACGPGGAGLAAVPRVGPYGMIVLADDAPRMVAAAARGRPASIQSVPCSAARRRSRLPTRPSTR